MRTAQHAIKVPGSCSLRARLRGVVWGCSEVTPWQRGRVTVWIIAHGTGLSSQAVCCVCETAATLLQSTERGLLARGNSHRGSSSGQWRGYGRVRNFTPALSAILTSRQWPLSDILRLLVVSRLHVREAAGKSSMCSGTNTTNLTAFTASEGIATVRGWSAATAEGIVVAVNHGMTPCSVPRITTAYWRWKGGCGQWWQLWIGVTAVWFCNVMWTSDTCVYTERKYKQEISKDTVKGRILRKADLMENGVQLSILGITQAHVQCVQFNSCCVQLTMNRSRKTADTHSC